MSNFSGTHYNSGCESGWTVYFEESMESEERLRRSVVDYGGGEEEEGDLSMVSDASSGPRNGFEEGGQMGFEENCHSVRRHGSKSAVSSKRKEEMRRWNQHSSRSLDDTASSPVFGFSKREMSPYRKEGLVENVKDFTQSHSRKQPDKKQSSFYQSSSARKSGGKVSGEEAEWE